MKRPWGNRVKLWVAVTFLGRSSFDNSENKPTCHPESAGADEGSKTIVYLPIVGLRQGF